MSDLLETLRRDGIVRLPPLAAPDVREVTAHLERCRVLNAHVPFQGKIAAPFREAVAGGWPMFCHTMADVINAPHLLELATSYLDLARQYLEADPLVYSLNAFWTQPAAARYEQTHKWHRDGDDKRFLVLYIYGTDVLTPEAGAHVFVKTSHRLRDDELPKDRAPLLETVLGPAGTMFLSDSRGLHLGTRPQGGLRSLLWIRWGVSDPPASYRWDKMAPVALEQVDARYWRDLTPAQKDALRLVLS